jgi:hypothetical protein
MDIEFIGFVHSRGNGIMVPQHTGDFFLSHDLHALVGVCIVSHDIAEADYLVHAERADPFQHGLQRFQIRVYIGNNGGAHGMPFLRKGLRRILDQL